MKSKWDQMIQYLHWNNAFIDSEHIVSTWIIHIDLPCVTHIHQIIFYRVHWYVIDRLCIFLNFYWTFILNFHIGKFWTFEIFYFLFLIPFLTFLEHVRMCIKKNWKKSQNRNEGSWIESNTCIFIESFDKVIRTTVL